MKTWYRKLMHEYEVYTTKKPQQNKPQTNPQQIHNKQTNTPPQTTTIKIKQPKNQTRKPTNPNPNKPLSIGILNVKPIRVHRLDVLVPVTEGESHVCGHELHHAGAGLLLSAQRPQSSAAVDILGSDIFSKTCIKRSDA